MRTHWISLIALVLLAMAVALGLVAEDNFFGSNIQHLARPVQIFLMVLAVGILIFRDNLFHRPSDK